MEYAPTGEGDDEKPWLAESENTGEGAGPFLSPKGGMVEVVPHVLGGQRIQVSVGGGPDHLQGAQ